MRNVVLLIAIWFATPALAQAPATFSVQDGAISYKLVHKLHEFVGTSKKAEGKARLLPNGTIQVMARAPVASFDSDNGNRDAHMLEAVEGAKYPLVELKATAEGFTMPAKFPATAKVRLNGVLTFHGVQKPQAVDLALTFTDANHVSVEGTFSISLGSFKVERPSLMFVKVDDKLAIETKLSLKRDK